jgi:hypothetical protein
MKKILIFIVVITLAAPLFAQKNSGIERKNALMINPWTTLLGVSINRAIGASFFPPEFFAGGIDFEHAVSRSFSVKLNFLGYHLSEQTRQIDSSNKTPEWIDFEAWASGSVSIYRIGLDARFYPSGNYLQGFFFSGGLQFHRMDFKASVRIKMGDFFGFGDGFDFSFNGDSYNTWSAVPGLGYKMIAGRKQAAFSMENILDFPIGLKFGPFKNDFPYSGPGKNIVQGVNWPRYRMIFGVAF